jgi:hypothetical protein
VVQFKKKDYYISQSFVNRCQLLLGIDTLVLGHFAYCLRRLNFLLQRHACFVSYLCMIFSIAVQQRWRSGDDLASPAEASAVRSREANLERIDWWRTARFRHQRSEAGASAIWSHEAWSMLTDDVLLNQTPTRSQRECSRSDNPASPAEASVYEDAKPSPAYWLMTYCSILQTPKTKSSWSEDVEVRLLKVDNGKANWWMNWTMEGLWLASNKEGVSCLCEYVIMWGVVETGLFRQGMEIRWCGLCL